ncbi:alpha/beta hydrolase [Microlunatus soli]|uniref:Acyl-CoA:diacylglycerol acyltransferase n=1 Tax=Microlunatus soli TaxID=630515 RepID=A0A1H1XS63_9ACTN|nr:alpha/beta hydrolase-fold protein [Microlunatus soli]SDT12088.1 S-formylglutathione hydrolase FrmB [Microlunatus soli]
MAFPTADRHSRRDMLRRAGGTALASTILGGTGWRSAQPARADDLTVVDSRTDDPRLKYYRFATSAIGWDPGVNVLVPADYETSGRRYPVLYLLHGGGTDADFRQWDGRMGIDIRSETSDLPLIVVMPDGGHAGWYSDPTGSAVGPRNWETFHIKQLLPWIDAHFRTVADASGRGVAGYSMGGFGALKYVARHPGEFASVSAHSGPASLRSQNGTMVHWANLSSAAVELGGATVYGVPWNESLVTADNPIEQLDAYRGKRVFLAAGTADAGVPLSDVIQESHVLVSQREFSEAMRAAGVAYHRREHPGGHLVDLGLFRDDLADLADFLDKAG